MHMDKNMCANHWMDTKGMHFLSTNADPIRCYGMQVQQNVGCEKLIIPMSPM